MDGASSSPTRRQRIAAIVETMLVAQGLVLVGANDNLRDAGLSSLGMVNLMLAVEDAFGLELPPERMTPDNFASITAIDALIAELE